MTPPLVCRHGRQTCHCAECAPEAEAAYRARNTAHRWPCEEAGGAETCSDADCPAYRPQDACSRCGHGAREHESELHGVRYCGACLRHGIVPLVSVCCEYIRPPRAPDPDSTSVVLAVDPSWSTPAPALTPPMTTPHPDQTAATTPSMLCAICGQTPFARTHDAPHGHHFVRSAPTPIAGRGETTAIFTAATWKQIAHRWHRRAHQTAATVRRMANELRTHGIEPDSFNPGMYGPLATPTPETPRPETIAPAKEPDAQMLAYEAWERDRDAAAPSAEGPREEPIYDQHSGEVVGSLPPGARERYESAAAIPGAQAVDADELWSRLVAEQKWDQMTRREMKLGLAALTSEVARLREERDVGVHVLRRWLENTGLAQVMGYQLAYTEGDDLAVWDASNFGPDDTEALAVFASDDPEAEVIAWLADAGARAARSLTPANPETTNG